MVMSTVMMNIPILMLINTNMTTTKTSMEMEIMTIHMNMITDMGSMGIPRKDMTTGILTLTIL